MNDDKSDNDLREEIDVEVDMATANFVRAVKRLVKNRQLPRPPMRPKDPFPYALELLEWLFRENRHDLGMGGIFYPKNGEDLLMGIAIDINYALNALRLCDLDIPEWAVWTKAREKQDEFYAKIAKK